LLSSLMLISGAIFVFLVPASIGDGPVAFLWPLENIYCSVEPRFCTNKDPFNLTQSIMTTFEASMGLIAFAFYRLGRHPESLLLCTISCSLTCAKTLLIFVMEYISGLENIGHNSAVTIVFMYIVPNGIWVLCPGLVAISCSKKLIKQCKLGAW